VETYPDWPNLAAMMFARARDWPQRPVLRHWRDGTWQQMRWEAFAGAAASVARALRARGIGAGDRVLVASENRPEVPIAETALMSLGAVPVPAYVTNTVADHAHILADSGARAAIVSTPALAARVAEAAAQVAGLDWLAVMEGAGGGGLDFAALAADRAAPDDIEAAAAAIPREALACLIYTSGTGGAARGVMLPHRAILSNSRGAFELLRPLNLKERVYLSFLPLSHAYEHTVGLFLLPSMGFEIAFSRGVEHLAADIMAVRPVVITVVPRVLEVIRGRILAQMAREPGWKQALFRAALAAGLRRLDGRPRAADRLLDPLLDRLVRARVSGRFGGRLVAAVSGGARLDPEVGRFFLALGVTVLQGYGQTEAGPVVSCNPPGRVRVDTVGPPLLGVELAIAGDGEILVRGDLVMQGYWNLPEATAAALRDGWLHTGDIGALDPDGYLRITDRKKDIIVLSGGETISPARIEGLLMAEIAIAQAVVAGDGESGLSALLVAAEGCDEVAIALAITRANTRLAVHERIRRHRLVPAFTLENGLLTPTQKIRRTLVLQAHKGELTN